ncbi:hypothetical protein BDF22DRAFT_679994 [Syncephalis plumigaleata]|nr:hypothetical protein BDF22DRAFT_679994 [Syncephalis plumigaleata]
MQSSAPTAQELQDVYTSEEALGLKTNWREVNTTIPLFSYNTGDSEFSQIHRLDPSIICAIDTSWIWDRIPVEDLDVPARHQPFNPEDNDALLTRQRFLQREEEKRWNDLDMARLIDPQEEHTRY